ncbi:hypothetical protein DTO96_102400 [Ephemeroptericola cinctiostellae]|uniref:Uncharacterized protein n=1 Tax=Ephemeroptericola cinctiostellae TaxID=2268024 RepID=A0A345DE57_9BURK|nr:hypothetical protein [Ephemeroptericola cinctiostellae]AXF86645.1 hypothetical protein DTO96_102400 [Ephemeroptericola cinctiostellae]
MTLENMHVALVGAIKQMDWTLGQVYTYEAMREAEPSPSVRLELTEGDDASMVGGGDALDVSLRWVARVLISAAAENAELLVRQYAFATARQLKRVGSIGAGIIRIVRVAPDEFKEPLNGYLTWMVEFEFDAPLGETIEADEPVINPMNLTMVKHCCTGDTEVFEVFGDQDPFPVEEVIGGHGVA